MNYKVISYQTLPSTNDYLKDNYNSLDNYTFIYTSNQTNGRGRMGRSWISEKDMNIAVSVLIKDFKKRKNLETITLLTACSLHKTLSKYISNIKIKWPNDLLIDNKKISGILVEGISKDIIVALIIGIGININQTDFKELNEISTSLKKELHQDFNLIEIRDDFIDTLINDLDLYLNNDDTYLTYLKNNLDGLNKVAKYTKDNKLYEGIIMGLDDEGKLIVNQDNNLLHIASGEIKIIR